MSGDQFRCVAANASGSITSNPAILTVNPAPATIWAEGWQSTKAGTYVITDNNFATIAGDGGSWIVYDSADVCGAGPHANTAEVISTEGNNKALS